MGRYKKKTNRPRKAWSNAETAQVFSAILALNSKPSFLRACANLCKELGRETDVIGGRESIHDANVAVVLNRIWGVVTRDPHDSEYCPPTEFVRSGPLSWVELELVRTVQESDVARKRKLPPTKEYLARIFGRSVEELDPLFSKRKNTLGLV